MTKTAGVIGAGVIDADVVAAIADSWSSATSAVPDEWTAANPARGQCDVSSFLLWEHAGGDLVLGRVFVDGDLIEHHYWNRIDGVDHDLTADQFTGEESIEEFRVLSAETLRTKQGEMRAELAHRIELLRRSVSARLGEKTATDPSTGATMAASSNRQP